MRKTDFVGVWRLESLEFRASSGERTYPMGMDAAGYLSYTEDGFMSVEIMKQSRRQYKDNDSGGGTIEEKVEAVSGYISYCGAYEVHENQVIHHVEISLFPNWISVDLIRYYELNGDRLTLSTSPYKVEGKEQSAHLVWLRRK